ncbi:MAG: hypothetical protein GX369_07770 [Euryarchaeota archaeon]|nr:hypothetical protein [Euryarchaeota archaeon]
MDSPTIPYTYPPHPRQRPLGITILAILAIIGGILSLISAIGLFIASSVVNVQEIIDQVGSDFPQEIIEATPLLFAALGIVFLISAILSFLIAYGYFKGKGWSWTLGVVLMVLSILFNVIGFVSAGFSSSGLIGLLIGLLVGIAIPIIILIYLFQTHVKVWFGKA